MHVESIEIYLGRNKYRKHSYPQYVPINTLTPKPAVTGHTTSILVGRISAGCCSERGKKAVGRVAIKGTLRGEVKGLQFISPITRSEEKRGDESDESILQIN
ncbi:hypothetical protein AVEN_183889-1 [Araneus ventricosus]|uniref:Uncharacterized protein n=1 Tax=Araneus ventricosus TaxID=182803 RepID=A0A4Y2LPR2_ARAVE|nr:hypothetical protein AVEN_183889-1 [Araneus ventricosus]